MLTELRRLQRKTLSARADTVTAGNANLANENSKADVKAGPRSVTEAALYPTLYGENEINNKVTFSVKDESVGMVNKGLMD